MKCSQCEKTAMFLVGPEGKKQIPLCLDCNLKLVQLMAVKNDMIEREMNYLAGYMDMATGFPGLTPRFPQRKVLHHTGDIMLNNIKIDNSIIGVLNTGTIGTVDSAVTAIKQSGEEKLSSAIIELSQAILSSTIIANEQKNQIMELLSVISTEATAPKENRRKTVVGALLRDLGTMVGGISGLVEIWNRLRPIFEAAF